MWFNLFLLDAGHTSETLKRESNRFLLAVVVTTMASLCTRLDMLLVCCSIPELSLMTIRMFILSGLCGFEHWPMCCVLFLTLYSHTVPVSTQGEQKLSQSLHATATQIKTRPRTDEPQAKTYFTNENRLYLQAQAN